MKFTHPPGATPVDGFTIRRGIHRGGFGEVYYAVSDGGKEVALKLLQHDQDVELRGVAQCLNLKHPNLVNLFDVKTDSHGDQWVVMEYISGTSLEDVLASFPRGMPLDEVRDWLSGIVAGVAHLHERGIVHRDLKPANVYRENGTVKVGDVGLSKQIGSDRRGAHTQSVGTVYYMAPEVAKGQYGPQVDVYSLGIMLYEMLTGRLPFVGESTAEVLMKHLTEAPNLDPIAAPFRRVLADSLKKDPQRRTQSVTQLADEFKNAMRALDVATSGKAADRVLNSEEMRSGVSDASVIAATIMGPPPVSTTSAAQAASTYARFDPHVETAPLVDTIPRPPVTPTSPPLPQKQHATRTTRYAPSITSLDWNRWVRLVVIVTLGLIVFSPGTWKAWVGFGLLALAYAVSMLTRSPFAGNGSIRDAHDSERSRRTSWPSGMHAHATTSWNTYRSSRTVLPTKDQKIEMRRELAISLTVAALCSCLLSAGIHFSLGFIQNSSLLPSPELTALFASTVLLASWIVLISGHYLNRSIWCSQNRRKLFLLAGVGVGSLAYLLDQFLLADFSRRAYFERSAVRYVGIHPLTLDGVNPTWLGYVVFFGLMLFLHRWWIDMNPQRLRRLGLWRLFTAGTAAWLVSMIFSFPQGDAILWAVTISAAVQLASPWGLVERQHSFRGVGP